MRKKKNLVGTWDSFQNRRRRRGEKSTRWTKREKKGVEQDKRRVQK